MELEITSTDYNPQINLIQLVRYASKLKIRIKGMKDNMANQA